MKNPPERADFFVLKTLKPPLFGVSQMGEVAEQSEVGGGTCIGRPPQSLRDSSPIPYGTGEPFAFLSFCIMHSAFCIYPSATSSIIIRVKPNAKKIVPMLECSPSDISGISSSTTT